MQHLQFSSFDASLIQLEAFDVDCIIKMKSLEIVGNINCIRLTATSKVETNPGKYPVVKLHF